MTEVEDPRETHDVTPDDLVAKVTDSDPNGNAPEGLAGDMGVSSERVAPLRGTPQDATHGAGPTHPDAPYDARDLGLAESRDDDAEDPTRNELTEGAPEVQPDLPPRTVPTQGAPNPLGPGPDHEPGHAWRTVQPGQDGATTGGEHGRSEFDAVERAEE